MSADPSVSPKERKTKKGTYRNSVVEETTRVEILSTKIKL